MTRAAVVGPLAPAATVVPAVVWLPAEVVAPGRVRTLPVAPHSASTASISSTRHGRIVSGPTRL